ncbi:MAG: hypothetical protein R3E14_10635 [Erythrobacter sp.]
MAIIEALTLALMAQGPAEAVVAPETTYDVGYEELVAGRDREAISAIEECEELAQDDPARLINHGIALARLGRYNEARTDFEAAARADSSVELETASGDWTDSRRLARKALAMLDSGEFARYYALNMQ